MHSAAQQLALAPRWGELSGAWSSSGAPPDFRAASGGTCLVSGRGGACWSEGREEVAGWASAGSGGAHTRGAVGAGESLRAAAPSRAVPGPLGCRYGLGSRTLQDVLNSGWVSAREI